MGAKGLSSLKRQVRKMNRDLMDEVEDAVEYGAEVTADEARAQVQTGNQIWTGSLVSSIYWKRDLSSTNRRSTYRVVVDVPYAAFVEFGTGPRQSPSTPMKFRFGAPENTPELLQEITEWVMTKPTFFGPRTPEIAWAITETISEVGTNPHPYLRPAWHTARPLMINAAEDAVKRVVRRL